MRRTASLFLTIVTALPWLHGADRPSHGALRILEAEKNESDFDRGKRLGRVLADEIRASTAAVDKMASIQNKQRDVLIADVSTLDTLLTQTQREQLKGIAEGAKVPENGLLRLNAFWLRNFSAATQGVSLASRTVAGHAHHWIDFDESTSTMAPLGVLQIENGGGQPAKTVLLSAAGVIFPAAGMNDACMTISLAFDQQTDLKSRFAASSALVSTLRQQTSLHMAVTAMKAQDGGFAMITDGRIPDARLLNTAATPGEWGPGEIANSGSAPLKDCLSFNTKGILSQGLNDATAPLDGYQIARTFTKSGRHGIVFSATDMEIWSVNRDKTLSRLGWSRDGAEGVALIDLPLPIDGASSESQTGTVKPRPRREESKVPGIYQLGTEAFDYELHPQAVYSGIQHSKLRFPSPIVTPFPENNTVHAELFRPCGQGPYPCVIVLHIAGGDFELSRLMARMLTRGNVAALFVKMPYYGERRPTTGRIRMVSGDLERGLTSMKQIVLDLRRTCDWIEHRPDLDGKRIGVAGVSLGSITGSLATAIEPRITHAGLVMGGAQLQHVLFESSEREAHEYREAWLKAGGTRESFAQVFAPYDPATYADRLQERVVFMISASEDRVIPHASTIALWEATGKQRILWYPCGHYTMAKYFLPALSHLVKFFQDWPARSQP